jgi:hypothetical protein
MLDCRRVNLVLVAQIGFVEGMGENHLRQSRFVARLDDKIAEGWRRE